MKKKGTGIDEAVVAQKGKPSKLNVVVYPAEAGKPYVVEVVPDKGNITLPKTDESFVITPGSVWIHKGEAFTAVNSSNPHTINYYSLTGDDAVSPTVINGIIKNNYVEQVQKFARTPKPWQQLRTISMIAISVIFGLLLFYLIREMATGFENIQEAIEGIKVAAQSGGAGEASGGASGADNHQEIAPGGV